MRKPNPRDFLEDILTINADVEIAGGRGCRVTGEAFDGIGEFGRDAPWRAAQIGSKPDVGEEERTTGVELDRDSRATIGRDGNRRLSEMK